MITLARLEAVLESCPNRTIGLVGDLFLDRYLEIEPGVLEISIETDLEAYQISQVRNSPGALGTVMNNLAALGVGRLVPVSVIGDDGHGYDLLKELKKLPVDCSHIIQDPSRLTPTYTKPLKQDEQAVWQELNRLDVRTRSQLFQSTLESMLTHLRDVFHATDGLIVLDQIVEENWGVIGPKVREFLEELSSEDPQKLIYIDSRAHVGSFHCGILKGNLSEFLSAAGLQANSHKQEIELAYKATKQLVKRTGSPAYCTLGEKGILSFQANGESQLVPCYPISGPVDIVGAGDSASSGIVTSLLAGMDKIEAAATGNIVASITVQQLGTTGTASPEQVRRRWHETHK